MSICLKIEKSKTNYLTLNSFIMLKNFFLFFVLCTLNINAQTSRCVISGPSNMSIGESANFSVSSNLAQCSNCYDWDVPSGLSIIGSDQNNSATISASQAGTYTIVVNYINENGCNSCTKIINVCPSYDVPNALIGEYYCSGECAGYHYRPSW